MAIQRDRANDPRAGDIERILSGYRPLPGIFDEMMDPQGRPRTHWQSFLGMLARLGTDEINRRFSAADRHLRESGVFYRVYEDPAGAERPWPLSHIPLIIAATEWEALRAGLIQRAELLEAVIADSYGAAKLVTEGRLPAALIAGNPEFLRPLVGVAPPGGAHLRFCAVDVGRAANGRWWVLGDRTQAPSGAGYALENRLALARAIPEIYRATHVNRLAPFFQAFQADLAGLGRRDDSRVCVLTPGPMNETYFEHAYLARYLGFLLVEGQDLTVRDDGVFVRTVSGLKRAEVLLRRLDGDFADPLELNAASSLGVPGLVQAVRDHKVVIANALGAGLVEARALLAFLPALAPAILGADLAIPNVATWWLGDADTRREMAGALDHMVIAPAVSDRAAGVGAGALGATLDPARRERVAQAIADRGIDYVVQEAVTLSTMPVWRGSGFEPRPFSLQQGGRTADAWVLSDGPVGETTLLPRPERIVINRTSGVLPSRAADNLFWVGRYIERAEATLRLVRARVNRTAEADETAAPLVERISALLDAWSAGRIDIPNPKAIMIARAALSRDDFEGSLPHLVGAARAAASVIRDRFSPDAWRALVRLAATIDAPWPDGPLESVMFERVDAALRIVASF